MNNVLRFDVDEKISDIRKEKPGGIYENNTRTFARLMKCYNAEIFRKPPPPTIGENIRAYFNKRQIKLRKLGTNNIDEYLEEKEMLSRPPPDILNNINEDDEFGLNDKEELKKKKAKLQLKKMISIKRNQRLLLPNLPSLSIRNNKLNLHQSIGCSDGNRMNKGNLSMRNIHCKNNASHVISNENLLSIIVQSPKVPQRKYNQISLKIKNRIDHDVLNKRKEYDSQYYKRLPRVLSSKKTINAMNYIQAQFPLKEVFHEADQIHEKSSHIQNESYKEIDKQIDQKLQLRKRCNYLIQYQETFK